MMLESNSSPNTGLISNVDVPYLLEKMPRLLFTSLRELVRRSIEGGYYLKAVFIFSARNVGVANPSIECSIYVTYC